MRNGTDTKTTWSLGIRRGEISGLPDFTWGIGDLMDKKSPLVFSSVTGEFTLTLLKMRPDFRTRDISRLIKVLHSLGLSEPPELRRVKEIYERFADDGTGEFPVDPFKNATESEWRKLLNNLDN